MRCALGHSQFMHRHAQHLALDVPQRLINAGDGAHQDGASAVEATAVHHHSQVVDARWARADQHVGEFLDSRLHRACIAFDNEFVPAEHAFVGLDFKNI